VEAGKNPETHRNKQKKKEKNKTKYKENVAKNTTEKAEKQKRISKLVQ
jgi:hypothetical protein